MAANKNLISLPRFVAWNKKMVMNILNELAFHMRCFSRCLCSFCFSFCPNFSCRLLFLFRILFSFNTIETLIVTLNEYTEPSTHQTISSSNCQFTARRTRHVALQDGINNISHYSYCVHASFVLPFLLFQIH